MSPPAALSPLTGLRVLDASRILAGPYCGQMLGDLGAEVVKLERPGVGDDTRGWGPPFHEALSAYFLSCNRNKKSVTLDLATPAGVAVFHKLVARSDILLENFKTSSAQKLGLSPEQLHAVNPKLIICSISGYGRTGPWSDVPGYDFAIQALSGMMSLTGPTAGPPCKTAVALTDVLTGLYAGVAVLACLHARKQSGRGYAIDLALLDCGVSSLVNLGQAYLTNGKLPSRQGNAHFQIVPYQLFATADGWLVLAVGNDTQWQRFCLAAGRPELAHDARYTTNRQRVQARESLVPELEVLLRTDSTTSWLEKLEAADVPCAPVLNIREVFEHPQALARNFRVTVHDSAGKPIDLLGSPFHIAGCELPAPTAAPELGQHTEEVLRDMLGYDSSELQALRKAGVI